MSKQLICAACGQVGGGQTKIKGNGLIELILWLCFLVPGIIYSIWRSSSRHKVCPSCGATNLIPVDSPIGKKLLSDQGTTLEQAQALPSDSPVSSRAKLVIIAAIVFFLLLGMVSLF